ncbi:MAG: patatin-like phospholipase family protein [Pseudomonadota bacterium]
MPCRLWLASLCLALSLAACSSSDRPLGPVCKGLCPKPDGPVSLLRATGDQADEQEPPSAIDTMASDELREQIRALMRRKADAVPAGVPERALGELPLIEESRLRLLALSSGGPFGAFGAGFLNGWSEQVDGERVRPAVFDVVTGVSAGALLATHAFLGREGDPVLARQYTTISTSDVLQQRSLFGALFSNSFFDTSPLRRTLEALVTPELLDQVARATVPDEADADGQPSRLLLVLAVDLDSGLPRIIDLGAIARSRSDPDRIDRYIDALMASSAIPVAFPPVFIDGAMHVDGGARLALFFNRFMEEQRTAIEDRTILAPRLDIIVNSEVTVEPACTKNSLVGIGQRSVDVVLNQVTLDSLYRTISEAEQDGIDVRYVTAEGSGCAPPDDPADLFQRGFLQCLFAFGKEVGSGATPFKTGLEDFPDLKPGLGNGALSGCGF